MTALPTPGADNNAWGDELNTWLEAGHDAGGLPKVLGDVTLGADATSLDLPGLDLSGWRVVRLIAILRHVTASEGGGDWERAFLRFNDDSTAADYQWGVINTDANNANNATPGYTPGIEFGHMTGPNADAASFSNNIADLILPGDTGLYKNVVTHSAMMFAGGVGLGTFSAGVWLSTSAITKVSIVPNEAGTDILAGSRGILIGLA